MTIQSATRPPRSYSLATWGEFTIDLLVQQDPAYDDLGKDLHAAIKAGDKAATAKAQKEIKKLRLVIQEKFFTYMYMARTDQSKYASFMTELDNKYSLLKDKSKHEYPTDMIQGHFAIQGRKWDSTYKRNKDKGDNSKSDKDKEGQER